MNQDIRRRLDRITDTLWAGGVTNPVTYIEQLSYLIYLKLLDEEENNRQLGERLNVAETVRLFPDQAERYRWSKWKYRSGASLRDFLRDEVFPYMTSLVRDEPQVADYFRDAVLEITDPSVLKLVIDEIDTIEFQKLGPDVKGDIFEYLLTHLGQSALNGQFRTPRQIRAFMTTMVDPDIGDSVYDPAAGTAGFLIDAVDHILAKYSTEAQELPIYGEEWLDRLGLSLAEAKASYPNLQTYRRGVGDRLPSWSLLEASIFGTDVSRQMLRIATMNLVLHGVTRARLRRANVLSELSGMPEEDLGRRYSVILSNPPFAGQIPRESIRRDLPTNSKKSELLFLALMMESLAANGRCAVVVPEGALFGTTQGHLELRRRLVEEFDLLAVVSLPAGAFRPYAGVKTSVLVFRHPGGPSPRRDVWFYDVSNDGYDPNRIQAGGRPETPADNDIPRLLADWADYKRSGFTSPPGAVAFETISDAPQRCWSAPVEVVADNAYNLSVGHYAPRYRPAIEASDPMVVLQEAVRIEQELAQNLSELLAEMENLS